MKRFWLLFKVVVSVTAAIVVIGYSVVQHQSENAAQQVTTEAEQWTGNATNGQYIARMSGCIACHTDYDGGGRELSGGRAIKTPFGVIYSPNITSDIRTGIGRWDKTDFVVAVKTGMNPDGSHYLPAFPYSAYSRMSTRDVVDLWAWLSEVAPVENSVPVHKVPSALQSNVSVSLWKSLYFNPENTWESKDRGEYLVSAAGHCFECHAQRSELGGVRNKTLSGNSRGPNGQAVPGITALDLEAWSHDDITFFLEIGMTPAGDFTGGSMTEVIEHSTAFLTPDDRALMARYLKSQQNTP